MKTLPSMIALALLLAACSMSKPSADSKSNWLRTCSSVSDCDDGLSCACGVCTRSCQSAATCEGGDLGAECKDVRGSAIASACASASSSASAVSHVCLTSCQDGDCGDGQRCVQGVCVGRNTADAGTLLESDAGAGEPSFGGQGGRGVAIGDGAVAIDDPFPGFGGDASVDASVPLCSDQQRTCCASDRSCPNDLVCHVDDSCIASGELDENGRATLQTDMPYGTRPLAADDAFVYGVLGGFKGPFSLVRWPLAGGSAEVLVAGMVFGAPPALVEDGAVLYFTAAASVDDLSFSLWRMPKDGSTEPEPSGTAGSLLVQNATHLFFSNDGDSRVVRLAKSAFGMASAREEVFTSSTDAPSTIASLAINSSELFIAEIPPPQPNNEPPATFTVSAFGLASSNVATVAESSRFSVRPAPLVLANDSYLVLFNDGAVDRFDLATLEVKPLSGKFVGGSNGGFALAGDHLFIPSADGVDDITLSALHRDTLPPSLIRLVPSDSDLFGIALAGTMPTATLIRVLR